MFLPRGFLLERAFRQSHAVEHLVHVVLEVVAVVEAHPIEPILLVRVPSHGDHEAVVEGAVELAADARAGFDDASLDGTRDSMRGSGSSLLGGHLLGGREPVGAEEEGGGVGARAADGGVDGLHVHEEAVGHGSGTPLGVFLLHEAPKRDLHLPVLPVLKTLPVGPALVASEPNVARLHGRALAPEFPVVQERALDQVQTPRRGGVHGLILGLRDVGGNDGGARVRAIQLCTTETWAPEGNAAAEGQRRAGGETPVARRTASQRESGLA